MKVRYIENKDFPQLLELYTELQAPLVGAEKQDFYSFAASDLCAQMARPDFKAIGLFDGDTLLGFSLGFAKSTKIFHFSAIYAKIRISKNLKNLLDFSISEVERSDYSKWEADCINPNIISILEKWEAKVDFTRMVKEIHNGR